MFRRRVAAVLDGLNIGLDRGKRRIVPLLKVLHETWRAPRSDIEDVIKDENLPIDIRARSDSDDRNLQRLRRREPNFIRNALQQHNIRSCILQSPGRVHHDPCLIRFPPLHPKSANLVDRLRLEAQVRANRNVVPGQVFDDLDLIFSTFELDHHGATLLHQADGVIERLFGRPVTHKRHIGDEKCPP